MRVSGPLANARIIESLSGPRGGYRLLRSPEEITALEVVEAIDGREPLFRCTEIRQRGPLAGPPEAYHLPCAVHVTMARAERAWREACARRPSRILSPCTSAMLMQNNSARPGSGL